MFTSEETLSNIIQIDNNLRRLTIKIVDVVWPWNNHLLNSYLLCIPNRSTFLEKYQNKFFL